MTASILDLKRSHARYNIALSMPTNAASTAVFNEKLNITKNLFTWHLEDL